MLKDEFKLVLERTGTYTSWLNGKVERHNQTSCEMIRVGTIYRGLVNHLRCLKCGDSTDKYNNTFHSNHGDVPDFLWYGVQSTISDFRIFGCKVEARLSPRLAQLDDRTELGYFVGTNTTKSVIRYWKPEDPYAINYCTTARFYAYKTKLPCGFFSPGT